MNQETEDEQFERIFGWKRTRRPFVPWNPDKLHRERAADVVNLGRTSYCHLAAKLLRIKVGAGEFKAFRDVGSESNAHHFLIINGLALDMGGPSPIHELQETMEKMGGSSGYVIVDVTLRDVERDIQAIGMDPEERQLLSSRFNRHIDENLREWRRKLSLPLDNN